MRWVRTENGERAHAVFHEHDKTTVCGIALSAVAAIVTPGPDDRCGNCDKEWRRAARQLREPVKRERRRDIYRPRNKERWT